MDERAKMKYNAKKFEELAVGVLTECQSADADKTGAMLHAKIDLFKNKNAIQVAYEADSLMFLSHQATQSVVNRDWYGRLKSLTSWYVVLFSLFLPFFVPFVKFADDQVWFACGMHGLHRARRRPRHKRPRLVSPPVQVNDQEESEYFLSKKEKNELRHESDWHRVKRKFYNFYSAPFTR